MNRHFLRSDGGGRDANVYVRYRNDSDPKKQAQQIMAIFPIVNGQKPDPRNAIPPRASLASLQSHDREAKDEADEGDLIDFGPYDANSQKPTLPSPKQEARCMAEKDTSKGSQSSVEDLLDMTKTPPPGSALLDFQDDLQKSLPKKNGSGT